jgi:hypothetical protein
MNESGEEIRKLAAMTRTGAPENCLRDLAALEQKLVFEAAWRDHILHALYVLLCGPAQTEPQARELETLLLALRDSSVRYTSRTRPLLESIQEIRNKEVGSGELASLQSDLTRLDFLHESFRQRVGKLDSQDQQEAKPEEKTAEAEKYVLLKTFDETRRFLEVSRQLIVGKPGDAGEKALATEFLAQFEEAGRIYLASKAGVCLSAVKALTEAKEALTGAAPRPEILSDRLPAATAALDEVRQAAARVTADDQTGRIATTSADMLARIHRLSTEKPPKAPAEIQRHIFALDGLLKDATKLAGDLRKIDETDEGDLALRGGPDGIGASEYRIPAETAQARLQEQVRSARRTLSRGILEALEPKPDRTRYQESYAWSVFLHRVLRSGLSGVGGIKPPPGKDAIASNPHLKFLFEELDKARQVKNLKNYADPTREYLNSIKDFLRY